MEKWKEPFLIKSINQRPALFFLHAAGILALVLLGAVLFPAAAQNEDIGKPLPHAESPIRITADRLITDTQQKTAEFTGHVSATQGDTVITSDKLKVYYKDGSESETTAGMDAIVRIVAEGNVTIVFDDQVAHTEHADYVAEKRMVVLTGANSRIVRGNNFISGHKITLYRDDGRIHVEGTAKVPVEAFLYSDESSLALPKKKN